jgi:hypothetical protein
MLELPDGSISWERTHHACGDVYRSKRKHSKSGHLRGQLGMRLKSERSARVVGGGRWVADTDAGTSCTRGTSIRALKDVKMIGKKENLTGPW